MLEFSPSGVPEEPWLGPIGYLSFGGVAVIAGIGFFQPSKFLFATIFVLTIIRFIDLWMKSGARSAFDEKFEAHAVSKGFSSLEVRGYLASFDFVDFEDVQYERTHKEDK